jgi:Polyketide cyclase / dehydrase and lipid transport
MQALSRTAQLTAHLVAGVTGLVFAYAVSRSPYMTSGLQFVAPLALIFAVHIGWIGVTRSFAPGYAGLAISRTVRTAVGLVVASLFAAVTAPMPASANMDSWISAGLMVLLCVTMIAVVLAFISVIIFVANRLITWLWRLYKARRGGPPDAGVNDLGVVVAVLAFIGAASLEGVAGFYSFATQDHASSTRDVAASPARVWRAVGTATSPAFPLPMLLKAVPQPVAIIVDEGADLGARRVVRFRGREGEGDLVLQVTRRTADEAVFTVRQDTSPIAMWILQQSLTFRVEPVGTGSRLTVTSQFARQLAPAWFFKPYVRLAVYFAVDVLARDTSERALRS